MSPHGIVVLLTSLVGFAGPAGPGKTAASLVTLRDGAIVRGEWVEPNARGQVGLIVRRAWLRRHAPGWANRWEAVEAPAVRRATAQRRERLESWRRERAAGRAGGEDRIVARIDRELTRLKDDAPPTSPLLTVKLNRNDVRSVGRASAAESRMLRLAWLSGVPEPEQLSVPDLKEALEGRGFDPSAEAPVSVERLLAPQVETDAAWLVRRAATEVTVDPGLRFVRYGGVVFPEPASGQPLNLGGGLLAVSALKDLLGENQGDPLLSRLREIAARGRVGAVVTKLDVAEDLSAVSVEMTLWVRQGPERWAPAGSRSARVRPEDLGNEPGKDLANDPQVSAVFQIVESLGLGQVPPEVKRRSLGIGAATQKALGLARSAAQADLPALALPVLEPAPAAGRP
jgi:hypothetical protein